MNEANKKIINKVRKLREKYNKMSLLFYELETILYLRAKRNAPTKELRAILKGLDFNKVEDLSRCMLSDLMKGGIK